MTDQLELIRAGGEVEFFDLSPADGVLNIGRHPDNDIVLSGRQVAPFHLVIDHRMRPVQVLVLESELPTKVNGEAAPAQAPLNNWDSVEVGGHTLILLQSAGATPGPQTGQVSAASAGAASLGAQARAGQSAGGRADSQPSVSVATDSVATPGNSAPAGMPVGFVNPSLPVPTGPGTVQPGPPLALPPPGARPTDSPQTPGATPGPGNGTAPFTPLPAPVIDHEDELILAQLPERELITDVDQMVTLPLTITNGGDLVASFEVEVTGIDPAWLVILPAQLNLNEEESGIVSITLTPPRLPTSLAGRHNFAVTIRCPEYPGHYTQLGATLVVNPYFEVQIGDLESRKQRVTWGRPVAENHFRVANGGNSLAQIQVEGRDDERKVQFEFLLPGMQQPLARQAELRLNPGQTAQLAMLMEPNDRRLIGMRNRTYQYTVTATPLGGQQFPRTIGGQLVAAPLIGKWTIALFSLLVVLLVIIFFSPRVEEFTVRPLNVDDASTLVQTGVLAGEPVLLEWRASRFSSVSIRRQPAEAPALQVTPSFIGSAEIRPNVPSQYELEAENLLSRVGIRLFRREAEVEIDVTPIAPVMSLNVSRDRVTSGESVQVSWQVRQADRAELTIGDSTILLPTTDAGEFTGQQVITPDQDTEISLRASHPSQPINALSPPMSQRVLVQTPTPTPLPNPAILVFDVSPRTIIAGQPVRVQWQVVDAPTVNISNIDAGLAPQGDREIFPQVTTNYQLSAQTGGGTVFSEDATVIVLPQPTPTPEPLAPVIDVFNATSTEIDLDDKVTIKWSISGALTAVEISSTPDLLLGSAFGRTGELEIQPKETTLIVLTAKNGEKSSTGQLRITVNPPPTPAPPVAPTVQQFQAEAGGQLAETVTIVRGTPVKLKWQVAGTVTSVEITGPNLQLGNSFGPSGELTVTPSETTFYVLKANNQDQNATKQVNVTVTDPPPSVVFFNAQSGASPPRLSEVQQTGFDSYQVTVGALVQLNWSVQNATNVTVQAGANNFGDRPAAGSLTFLYDGTFDQVVLTPKNSSGVPANATSLAFQPVQVRPPGPTGLNGQVNGNGQNVISWNYPSEFQQSISGFRVYRASVPEMAFTSVGEVPATQNSFTDPVIPNCSRAYFVVATYTDFRGQVLETDPTPTSWFSPGCQ